MRCKNAEMQHPFECDDVLILRAQLCHKNDRTGQYGNLITRNAHVGFKAIFGQALRVCVQSASKAAVCAGTVLQTRLHCANKGAFDSFGGSKQAYALLMPLSQGIRSQSTGACNHMAPTFFRMSGAYRVDLQPRNVIKEYGLMARRQQMSCDRNARTLQLASAFLYRR